MQVYFLLVFLKLYATVLLIQVSWLRDKNYLNDNQYYVIQLVGDPSKQFHDSILDLHP